MADLQVVYTHRLLSLSSVQLVSLDPPIVSIVGSQLDQTSEVRINGVSAQFHVLSPTTLLAGLPEAQSAATVNAVEVYTSEPAQDEERVRLEILLGSNPQTISGLQRLVQTFLKLLFTTPRSNIFSSQQGGGALRILSMVDGQEASRVIAAFSVSFDRAKSQLLAAQQKSAIPSTEKLLEAALLGAEYDPQRCSLTATILLTSQAREQARASVSL